MNRIIALLFFSLFLFTTYTWFLSQFIVLLKVLPKSKDMRAQGKPIVEYNLSMALCVLLIAVITGGVFHIFMYFVNNYIGGISFIYPIALTIFLFTINPGDVEMVKKVHAPRYVIYDIFLKNKTQEKWLFTYPKKIFFTFGIILIIGGIGLIIYQKFIK